jgi:subtilisin family serine protease
MLGIPRSFAALIALTLLLSACGGGGGGGGVNPNVTPTPGGTSTPSSESAFVCPTSDTSLARARSASASEVHRGGRRAGTAALSTTQLVVTYSTGAGVSNALDSRVAALGAKTINEIAFSRIGRTSRVIRVSPANLASVQRTLRAVPGVSDVSPLRRAFAQVVTTPYLGSDPYFNGSNGVGAPLYQSASVGGQWDMHVIGLEHALAYSQSGNGSGVTNAGALGSPSVKLAIIDTGEDVTHPDLSAATIVRTRCFITDLNNNSSTGTFVTDGFGHGTDVTGIAAAASTTSGYGFAGAGGKVGLMLYRVFPTPDDTCASPDSSAASNDPQCGAADVDIASGINDAVANGANVINLSLGLGEACVSGQDPDTVEGNAIANAIAAKVIVVASSGNNGSSSVSAPACDPGVIAAGASAYNDGQPNGSAYSGANAEYVASYSDVGSTNDVRSVASWGIVAPGGDPGDQSTCTTAANAACDADYLHWIENIWTTTPFQSSTSDEDFAGQCDGGEFNEVGNCRTLIAGTSMSSPHVAGAAALILAVNPAYASPTAMKQLLCSTADDIGDPSQGCGRLNVYNAMAVAVGDSNPPTPAP